MQSLIGFFDKIMYFICHTWPHNKINLQKQLSKNISTHSRFGRYVIINQKYCFCQYYYGILCTWDTINFSSPFKYVPENNEYIIFRNAGIHDIVNEYIYVIFIYTYITYNKLIEIYVTPFCKDHIQNRLHEECNTGFYLILQSIAVCCRRKHRFHCHFVTIDIFT